MSYSCFHISREGAVAHVEIARAEKANSMTGDFWRELPEVMRELDHGGDVRACILSGQGKHFSAGMDFSFFMQSGFGELDEPRKRAQVTDVILGLQAALDQIEAARFPVIAAIHGACVGGALDMIAACDLRYASQDAYFGIEEINIGMMADLGSLQRLPLIMPEGLVRELAYTGDKLTAESAVEAGLLNRLYASPEEMMTAVRDIAAKIAAKPPLAISASKKCFNHGRNHGLSDALGHAALLQATYIEPGDIMVAMTARREGKEAAHDDLMERISGEF